MLRSLRNVAPFGRSRFAPDGAQARFARASHL